MNPDTNKFEQLHTALQTEVEALTLKAKAGIEKASATLVRPNGQPVPETWTQFQTGETVVIKNYTFKVAYIGETAILFEPVGPVLVGQEEDDALL
jgi:ribonuclease BN (tRNA processing enzyme)